MTWHPLYDITTTSFMASDSLHVTSRPGFMRCRPYRADITETMLWIHVNIFNIKHTVLRHYTNINVITPPYVYLCDHTHCNDDITHIVETVFMCHLSGKEETNNIHSVLIPVCISRSVFFWGGSWVFFLCFANFVVMQTLIMYRRCLWQTTNWQLTSSRTFWNFHSITAPT